ncbi:MAG: ribosome assembly cofactor RimP [Flavobacteriales bacterium]|nr:ribosome assembly cofactor RimP [Flavobacteriales bacterium]
MISVDQVKALIKDKLEEKDCFVVELEVRPGNNILLEVDSMKGFTIQDCVEFSRAVEHNLDRETEDFELHVSSPGLDKPFRVKEQYLKNIGREVKVIMNNDEKISGLLTAVNDDGIEVEYSYKEKVEGKKKKQTVVEQKHLDFNTIKETTLIISFK